MKGNEKYEDGSVARERNGEQECEMWRWKI